jgi:uncharacterized protein YegP (UPF0339 family)
MTARFEIVRSDAAQPWHARFRAANGRIVWTTEQYARRGGALNAVTALADRFGYFIESQRLRQVGTGFGIEVRDVDERTQP